MVKRQNEITSDGSKLQPLDGAEGCELRSKHRKKFQHTIRLPDTTLSNKKIKNEQTTYTSTFQQGKELPKLLYDAFQTLILLKMQPDAIPDRTTTLKKLN